MLAPFLAIKRLGTGTTTASVVAGQEGCCYFGSQHWELYLVFLRGRRTFVFGCKPSFIQGRGLLINETREP
ncbi:hypothetical protein F4861DRAFT_510812 [Xylaria intraflava]|nr:hypothetical protein F4861DRAFT_510812 [Xylaria intraflava]